MNTELEERLTESMRQRVGGIMLTGDVLGRATRNHRRRTMTIRIGYAVGVTGLAGVVAVGLTLGNGAAPRQDAGKAPAVQAQPASLRLVAAAEASDNISYRMRLTTRDASGKAGLTSEGAFDPRTDTGYVRTPQDDSVQTELLINGTRYEGGEPPLQKLPADKGPGETYGRYGQYPGKYDQLSVFGRGNSPLRATTPDPAALLKALRAQGATITENPDGTLHFSYTTKSEDGSDVTSGDVTTNADGRIAKMVLTIAWQATKSGKVNTGTFGETLELYDYGVKVSVKRPTDVVPAN